MKNRNIPTCEELSAFCSQIALMLGAGIPITEGVETVARDESSELYASLSENVEATGSLGQALSADVRWPAYLREMTVLGERTGKTEAVMKELAAHYEREARIRSAVSSAVAYPLTMGAMLAVIVLILLWKVVPLFRRVLEAMGGGITENGRALINVGTALGWIVLGLVGLGLVIVAVCLILLKTGAREKVLSLLKKVFPALGRVSARLSASRAAGVFSMMLSSGFPMEEALNSLPNVLNDPEAEARVQGIQDKLAEGRPFADALEESALFEPLHNRMIRMGVAAGCEEEVMGKVAALYEEQTEDSIAKLVSIIEPTLVAVLSVVIGAILLCVMQPMAGILSSIL